MGAGEKKVAIALVVVLAALVAAYVLLPDLGRQPNDMAGMMPPGMAQAAGGPAQAAGKGAAQPASAKGGAGGAACATGGGGQAVKTQEFGKAGAKVEIIALLPITHGCHTNTEAELKRIQQKHPSDIHLVVADLFGPDAPKYQKKVGGGQRTLVSINGKTQFDLNGKKVMFERQEGMSYVPADLEPVIEQQLKSKSA
jgi:hypothetical protein